MNCQTFSTGFSSGDFAGRGSSVMLAAFGSYIERPILKADAFSGEGDFLVDGRPGEVIPLRRRVEDEDPDGPDVA